MRFGMPQQAAMRMGRAYGGPRGIGRAGFPTRPNSVAERAGLQDEI
jgi:hypothetical protein